jgi:predicted metal-dependent phosphoesterase TrpH
MIAAVLKQACEVGLGVIAITDHDETRGSLEPVQQAGVYGIGVIRREISTGDGHLLALIIQENIPTGLSLDQTIRLVADQGGLCIAPHPGGMRFNSLKPEVTNAGPNSPLRLSRNI